jgi:hypothetical protein
MEQKWTKYNLSLPDEARKPSPCHVICHSDIAGQITYPVLWMVNQLRFSIHSTGYQKRKKGEKRKKGGKRGRFVSTCENLNTVLPVT